MTIESHRLDHRGVIWGGVAVAIVLALSFIGSDRLVWFDAALVGYSCGAIHGVDVGYCGFAASDVSRTRGVEWRVVRLSSRWCRE